MRASCFVLCLAGVFCAGGVVAQDYPTKPIQVIVPFAPGGSTDVVFRILAPQLSKRLGQQVLIVNRPGGAATIGMNVVAKSAPDGYTFGVATLSFAANPPFMAGQMPFDTEKDLVPLCMVSLVPIVLTVHPSVRARSVKELLALAKAKPGVLNYGSSGIASSGHLAAALFESMSGVKMTHVPYSATAAVPAIVAGQVDMLMGPIPSSLPFVKTGQLMPLGVTTLKPDPRLPGVPPIAEAGVPNFEVYDWSGIVAPAGIPRAVIDRLSEETMKSLADGEVKRRIEGAGALVAAKSPEEFGKFIKKELATWAKIASEIRTSSGAAGR